MTRAAFTNCSPVRFQFKEDGTYKIVQFADIHYHNGDSASSCSGLTEAQKQWPCTDANNTAFMASVLDAEKPDLVVFTGDNNDGGATKGVSRSIDSLLQPIISRDLPFAAVFGNHDEEANLERSELMDVYTKYSNFLGEAGPSTIHGYGNYALTLTDHSSDSPKFNLFFFDSGDYSKYSDSGISGYDWIWGDQIAWYLEKSKELEENNNGTQLDAFAFFHIPLPEYETMISEGEVEISGEHNEGVCAGALNSGMFATMVERGEIRGVTVGHDHCNDYCGNYKGIDLCYGGGTGYDGYGCPDNDNWARRSRIIQISNFGEKISSWKRLDDGTLTTKDVEDLWSKEANEVRQRRKVDFRKLEVREDIWH